MDDDVGELVARLDVVEVEAGEHRAVDRVAHDQVLRAHPERLDLGQQPPGVEDPGAVRRDLHAGADLAELRRALEDRDPQALPGERESGGQAADAPADHDHVGHRLLSCRHSQGPRVGASGVRPVSQAASAGPSGPAARLATTSTATAARRSSGRSSKADPGVQVDGVHGHLAGAHPRDLGGRHGAALRGDHLVLPTASAARRGRPAAPRRSRRRTPAAAPAPSARRCSISALRASRRGVHRGCARRSRPRKPGRPQRLRVEPAGGRPGAAGSSRAARCRRRGRHRRAVVRRPRPSPYPGPSRPGPSRAVRSRAARLPGGRRCRADRCR